MQKKLPVPVASFLLYWSWKYGTILENKRERGHAMRFLEDLHHPEKYLKVLLKWGILGVLIGIMGGLIGSAFHYALHFVTEVREHHTWLIFLLPLGGLLSVGLYRVAKMTGNRGTNEVIDAILDNTQVNPLIAPLIFAASSITHLFGGSAGREGAALQIGGSIGNALGEFFRFDEKDTHVIIMCGMSAGFSALFGTPMAAAIFALEVISIGIMHYSALVPCVGSAMIAHFVATYFKVKPERFTVPEIPAMDPVNFFKVILL